MAKRGRPTDYDPEYHTAKAYEFCAEFGFTDKKLARLFDVDVATVQRWKKSHPEFCDSIRAGKDEYDSDAIEKSLRRRSVGFRFTETTRELPPLTKSEDPTIESINKLIITKTVSKFVVPDTKAMEFWLRNRRNKRWPDKQQLDLSGELGLNVNEMTKERQAELKELALLRAELALRERREDDGE